MLPKKHTPRFTGEVRFSTHLLEREFAGFAVSGSLEVLDIRSTDGLNEVIQSWEALVVRRPMRSPAWLLGWWEQFGGDSKELLVLLVRDQGELIGIAPLYVDRVGSKQVVRLLGSGVVCTDHTTWFSKLGSEERVGRAVANYFTDSAGWNRLQLECVGVDDPAINGTLCQFGSQRFLAHRKSSVNCWKIRLPDTWDQYLEMLSKSHRKRCRRLIRAYFDTGRAVVHEATADNFEDVWRLFRNLHAMRWGNERRPDGSFADRRFLRFHEELSRELFRRNQLRLCYLSCDEQPVAAEYQFVDHDTLYAYQSGMDPRAGDCQPGNLSLIATIQYCIVHGLKSMDLLRGDEPYKAHWRGEPSARHDLRVWPNGVLAKFELGLLGVQQLAADWMKRK